MVQTIMSMYTQLDLRNKIWTIKWTKWMDFEIERILFPLGKNNNNKGLVNGCPSGLYSINLETVYH